MCIRDRYKIRDNAILVLEEEEKIISMLHLNPYTMIVNGYEFPCNYIVAVATDPDYRHQGCMRALLERALNDICLLYTSSARRFWRQTACMQEMAWEVMKRQDVYKRQVYDHGRNPYV